ncbi:MAG: hypothetical protein ACRCSV_03595, partial [Chlamydiales bacterium]
RLGNLQKLFSDALIVFQAFKDMFQDSITFSQVPSLTFRDSASSFPNSLIDCNWAGGYIKGTFEKIKFETVEIVINPHKNYCYGRKV